MEWRKFGPLFPSELFYLLEVGQLFWLHTTPELKTEPVEKKKKKTNRPNQWKKKKKKRKKKERTEQPTQKKKKKVKVVKSCDWYCLRVPHVCLITKMSLSYKLWKQSYRLSNNLFCYESHHFWVMSYGNWEFSYQICQSKRPLT